MVMQFSDEKELFDYLDKCEDREAFLRLSKTYKDRFLINGKTYYADDIEKLLKDETAKEIDKTHKFEKGEVLMCKYNIKVRVVDYGWDDNFTLWYECEPADFKSITREFKEDELFRV